MVQVKGRQRIKFFSNILTALSFLTKIFPHSMATNGKF